MRNQTISDFTWHTVTYCGNCFRVATVVNNRSCRQNMGMQTKQGRARETDWGINWLWPTKGWTATRIKTSSDFDDRRRLQKTEINRYINQRSLTITVTIQFECCNLQRALLKHCAMPTMSSDLSQQPKLPDSGLWTLQDKITQLVCCRPFYLARIVACLVSNYAPHRQLGHYKTRSSHAQWQGRIHIDPNGASLKRF